MVWRRSETVSYSWHTSTHYKVDLSLITKSLQQIWKGNLSQTMDHSKFFGPTKGVIRPRFIIPFNSFEDPCQKRQESQSSTLLILQMWFVWWNWRVPTLHTASWLHLRLIRNRTSTASKMGTHEEEVAIFSHIPVILPNEVYPSLFWLIVLFGIL